MSPLFKTIIHAVVGSVSTGIGQVAVNGQPLTLGSMIPVAVGGLSSAFSATRDQPKDSLGAVLHAIFGGGATLIAAVGSGQPLKQAAVLAAYAGLSTLVSASDPSTLKAPAQ